MGLAHQYLSASPLHSSKSSRRDTSPLPFSWGLCNFRPRPSQFFPLKNPFPCRRMVRTSLTVQSLREWPKIGSVFFPSLIFILKLKKICSLKYVCALLNNVLHFRQQVILMFFNTLCSSYSFQPLQHSDVYF